MKTKPSITESFEKWAEDLTRYATVLVGADDAVDVVNQAFVDVMASGHWNNPEVIDPKRYLYRATLNAARGMRRAQTRREAREWRTRPEQVMHLELLADPKIIEAVNALSVGQRAVIYLAYWEDMTPASIASFLGVRDGTVRRQLARGRASLRKALA
ncbi:MAG: RNA polymerase sigma factor [Acidimicrobiales bacterium]